MKEFKSMRKCALLLFFSMTISFPMIGPAIASVIQFGSEEAEVIIFHPGMEHGSPRDIGV